MGYSDLSAPVVTVSNQLTPRTPRLRPGRRAAAIDFETFYSKEVSITIQGTRGYLRDPQFEAYLVSIVTSDGTRYVGDPRLFPWLQISGPDWTWVSHNAAFDDPVYRFLQEMGAVTAAANPGEWHCTADMAAYLGAPRSLAGAVSFIYDVKLDKGTRDRMKGKRWPDMTAEFQEEVVKYAGSDSDWCLKLWLEHEEKWPEHERQLSIHTRRMALRGFRADVARLERALTHLGRLQWAAVNKIPWTEKGAILSPKLLADECRRNNIEAPKSLAMDDEECTAWEDKYSKDYPWVAAMRLYRRTNSLLKKVQAMLRRVGPNGRLDYALKYFGAHTGRWSGDGGVNMQNLSQGEMFGAEWWDEEGAALIGDMVEGPNALERIEGWGVDLRKALIPEEGQHYNVADLSQIEPRVLWVLCGDNKSLDLVRSGMSPYEAHARATMGWTGGNLKELAETDLIAAAIYRLAKARVLALGYAAGWLKFITMARMYGVDACFDEPVTQAQMDNFEEYLKACKNKEWNLLWQFGSPELRRTYVNSWMIVMDFRDTNPKIKALWKKMHTALELSVGGDLIVTLPSGRKMIYRQVAVTETENILTGRKKSELTGIVVRQGKPMRVRLYGGLLVENLVQATARDVFAEGVLRIDAAGHEMTIHIHDEAVAECPLEVPAKSIGTLLAQAPSWMPGLPVSSSAKSFAYYTK